MKVKVNHDVTQNSIILGIFIFSFVIIWNYLNFFNNFVFLFIKLGSVLLLINIYLLYRQSKSFWKVIKRTYYDRYDWFKYSVYGIVVIILLIVFLNLPSQEELENKPVEQLINLSPFNPIYFGENITSVTEIVNFSSLTSNSTYFQEDECRTLVNDAIELREIKSSIDINGRIISNEIFSTPREALDYAEKYATASYYVKDTFCETNIDEINTFIVQYTTNSPNAIADKSTNGMFCAKINGEWKLIEDKDSYQCRRY